MTRLAQVSDIHCLLVANTMPTALRTGYNDTTLRQIQELREEYSIRVVDVLDTWKNWQGRAGGSAEYRRRIEIISEEIREQLQSLVGSRIPKIEPHLALDLAQDLGGDIQYCTIMNSNKHRLSRRTQGGAYSYKRFHARALSSCALAIPEIRVRLLRLPVRG